MSELLRQDQRSCNVGSSTAPIHQSIWRKPLAGKTALVTGGSRGIGRAAVLALAEAGADVAVNYRNSDGPAEACCEEAIDFGVRSHPFRADISHESDAKRMVEIVLEEFGRIDILVNNAGITRDKSFLKMTWDMWMDVLGVNLYGLFTVTHEILGGMIDAGWGRIVNVASIIGETGGFGQANYAASKGGLIAFTKTLARETAKKGVTVNAVSPGFIETDMTRDLPEPVLQGVKATTPLGRLGRPEEVAAAIAFLALPQASYITGQVISVNGGMYM